MDLDLRADSRILTSLNTATYSITNRFSKHYFTKYSELDVLEGDFESCIPKFEKAIEIAHRLFRDVMDIYVNYLSCPRLAISAAGDDVDRLNYATRILGNMQYNDLAAEGQRKVKLLLEEKCSQSDASGEDFVVLADIYARQEEIEKAVEYRRNALKCNYSQVHWHLELARLLAETSQVSEAIDEARICLRLRPGFKAAEKMIGKLCILPEALN